MNDTILQKKLLTQAVLTNADGLKRFAMSLCKDEVDSEELVAETVIKAFEHFHQLKDHNRIKQWLFRILNNQFISIYRRRKNHPNQYTTIDNNFINNASFSLFEEISNSSFVDTGNPEKQFISKLTQSSIEKAIKELPDEFRMAIVLCDIEDFSYAEIAVITHVPVGTVRSRIARARNLLQKKLWKQADELGITRLKTIKENKDHECTCGKNEKTSIETNEQEK